jgi:hypothetical protein
LFAGVFQLFHHVCWRVICGRTLAQDHSESFEGKDIVRPGTSAKRL